MTKNPDGGCLCGALRFTTDDEPVDCCYCHCRLCQRSSGAPVLAWASFPASAFRYTRGAPARYASSAHGVREFCAACGTQLVFRSTLQPALVEVNVGAMDAPVDYPPQFHIHCASAIAWLALEDGLPRHEGAEPPSPS
jgi:hypothetical protein